MKKVSNLLKLVEESIFNNRHDITEEWDNTYKIVLSNIIVQTKIRKGTFFNTYITKLLVAGDTGLTLNKKENKLLGKILIKGYKKAEEERMVFNNAKGYAILRDIFNVKF